MKDKGTKASAVDVEDSIPTWKRNLFGTILADIDDGISVQDRDLRIIYANDAHKRVFGDDLEGRYCYQIYERRPEVCPDCPVVMAFSTGKPFRATHLGCDKNGKELAADIVASPVFDGKGEIVAGIEVVRTVTEQFKANEELVRKSEKLKRLAAVAREISSGLDLPGVLQRVVETAAGMVNADAAMIALLDKENELITFPYAYNLPRELCQVTDRTGNGVAGDVIAKCRSRIDNDYAESELSRSEFVEAGITAVASVPLMIAGTCVGAIGVMNKGVGREFTQDHIDTLAIVSSQAAVAVENARLYDELSRSAQKLEARVKERTEALSRMYHESERKGRDLEQANRKLREVDRLKSEFLANMSHELRTPLNSIIGFSKLVLDGLDGDVNDEQKSDLSIVHDNGLELLRLIDDLLNLAKIEAGRSNLMLAEVSPGSLVTDVIISMSSVAREKKLALEASIPEGLDVVNGDAGKIRQVLLNLIGNAIKFTEKGRIDVAIEQTPEETVFSVTDTGVGISPEQIDEVFERFHQAAPGVAGLTGVGLGLTISKRFVEMHGGRIWVESEPGKGSIFYFAIPRKLKGSS